MKSWSPYLGLLLILLLGAASIVQGVAEWAAAPSRADCVRIGYFPNLTHGPVLLALFGTEPPAPGAEESTEWGAFQEAAGPGVRVLGEVFESGPFAVEALFAREVDLASLGPNPAVNGYVRSRGEAVRVVAGCTSGGAGLVVRDPAAIRGPADFAGRTLATPGVANTQDMAARAWLAAAGLAPADEGGDLRLVAIPNSEQLSLFRRGEIDAAWAPEPWTSRLVVEGKGAILVDERDLWPPDGRFATTLLAAHPRFLQDRPGLAGRLVAAHARIVAWVRAHPDAARARIGAILKHHLRKSLPEQVLRDAFSRVEFTTDPLPATVAVMADRAFRAGFLGKTAPDLSGLYDRSLLRAAETAGGR